LYNSRNRPNAQSTGADLLCEVEKKKEKERKIIAMWLAQATSNN